MEFTKLIIIAFFKIFSCKANLIAENISLRQQLAIYKRKHKRIPIKNSDRIFWVFISKFWSKWKSALIIVKPATVVRWHKNLFKIFWRLKSRKKPGRPKIDAKIRGLIRQMSQVNPTWGVPHIKSELTLLGYDVAESTVAKYMLKHPKPPSQTWRTFLKNHAADIVACDFLTIYTVTFRV